MQIKPKSERTQEIELDQVLVNQIFQTIKPVLHWTSKPLPNEPDLREYTLEKVDESIVEIRSQSDDRLNEFPKVFTRCFGVTSDDREGFSVPIGALRDTCSEAVARCQISENMFRVRIPRDLYSIILAIRNVFEEAGLYVTNSDVIRYMFWTKFPEFITPNGFAMICNSTSWFCDSIGHLCLFEASIKTCRFQEFYSFSEDKFMEVFNFKGWDTKFDTTSVTIHFTNRVSILLVELLKEVDSNSNVTGSEDTTIISKEDTNNESIKRCN